MSVHEQALAAVAADYQARGYQVEVEPAGAGLPAFLSGFRPDLIARGASENVVVEVKVGTRTAVADRLRDIAQRVNSQPGWRFSVVFADPASPTQFTEGDAASLPELEKRVQTAQSLLLADQREAAFLLLWSALEGLLRLLAARADLPLKSLPPSALIRELYSEGELSRDQFETLIAQLPLRNQLVHGLNTSVVLQPAVLAEVAGAILRDVKSAA